MRLNHSEHFAEPLEDSLAISIMKLCFEVSIYNISLRPVLDLVTVRRRSVFLSAVIHPLTALSETVSNSSGAWRQVLLCFALLGLGKSADESFWRGSALSALYPPHALIA
jgi:hypothetical protein